MQQEMNVAYNKPRTVFPEKGPAHFHMNAITGRWRVQGYNSPSAPDSEGEFVSGEESYEWLDGHYFLVHRFERHIGSNRISGMGWIGYDPGSGSYYCHSISNNGQFRVYEVLMSEGVLRFDSENERGVVNISHDGNIMSIHWEHSTDGKHWQPLYDLEGHRSI